MEQNLLFEPTEKFTKDHDIKILKIDFNSDIVGTGANQIGQVHEVGTNVSVGIDQINNGWVWWW